MRIIFCLALGTGLEGLSAVSNIDSTSLSGICPCESWCWGGEMSFCNRVEFDVWRGGWIGLIFGVALLRCQSLMVVVVPDKELGCPVFVSLVEVQHEAGAREAL